MELGLNNKTVLLTGGGSGIGLETTKLLNQEGALVIAVDRDITNIQSQEFMDPEKVTGYECDVTQPDQLEQLHGKLREKNQTVDILINCAGITGVQGDFKDISLVDWQHVFDVNLFGAVNTTKEFLADFEVKDWGRIIFLASEDGQQPYPDEIPYCCTKASVLALTKGLAQTLGPQGVLVNAVSPAFIETPMTDKMMDKRAKKLDISFGQAIEGFLENKRPFMTSNRRGKAEEVANVIAFLCSEKASFVNGSQYRVDANSIGTI